MKSKATVYILAFMVAAVWGLIIYRVVAATGGDNDDVPPNRKISTPKEPLNDYAYTDDTTSLKLNYPDPFALETKPQPDTNLKLVRQVVHPTIKMTTPMIAPAPLNWSFIKYSGYIKNPHTKRLIALMNINGKSLMLSEGESAEQVKLIKNLRDSIKVSYHNKTKFITVNADRP